MKGFRDERENGYQQREKMGIVPPRKEKNESERRMRERYLRRRESKSISSK
jgi:hypothetical protein